MTKKRLDVAIADANRFLIEAKILARQKPKGYCDQMPFGALSASIKRKSLDLTKSLAVLRSSDYK